MLLPAEGFQIVAQAYQLRVVAGRQRTEGHLLIAGILNGGLGIFRQLFPAPAAHRAVDVSRLTEPAAPDASPEYLQGHPVMDDLR